LRLRRDDPPVVGDGDLADRGNIMFRRTRSRFAIAALAAAVATCMAGSAPADAAPPTHVRDVERDVAVTIPPLAECPGDGNAASIDLLFTDIFHLIFTDTTFHVTETQTGTFVVRSASGEALATGHFATTSSEQGPTDRFTHTFTSNVIATGRATDGTRVQIHLTQHFTVTPDGDVTVDRTTASCN
jgi:hypothetical protein